MGTRAEKSTRNHYPKDHQHTSVNSTRPHTPIWARNRCIPHWHRSSTLPTWPTNNPARWNLKARTTKTMWIPLAMFHKHRTKLPHLWLRILGSSKRPLLLVPSPQRHRNPCSGIHQPCKSQILSRTTQNWPKHCRIHPRTSPVQPPVKTRSIRGPWVIEDQGDCNGRIKTRLTIRDCLLHTCNGRIKTKGKSPSHCSKY